MNGTATRRGPLGRFTSTVPIPQPGSLLWGPWKAFTTLNVRLYRLSGGRIGGKADEAPVCVLHHTGAKSGAPRESPLLYLRDGSDLVLVASMGGAPKHPAWFHNLRAHPEAEVEIDRDRVRVRAREATDAERERLWPRLTEIWPAFEHYQARTSRRIPVLLLSPR